VSHVGKIYGLLSQRVAEMVVQEIRGVREVYVWLCSQIGQPVGTPLITAVRLIPRDGASVPDLKPAVEHVVERELSRIEEFSERLVRGELAVW
jgi:S-adenosylmethionine synthetase